MEKELGNCTRCGKIKLEKNDLWMCKKCSKEKSDMLFDVIVELQKEKKI